MFYFRQADLAYSYIAMETMMRYLNEPSSVPKMQNYATVGLPCNFSTNGTGAFLEEMNRNISAVNCYALTRVCTTCPLLYLICFRKNTSERFNVTFHGNILFQDHSTLNIIMFFRERMSLFQSFFTVQRPELESSANIVRRSVRSRKAYCLNASLWNTSALILWYSTGTDRDRTVIEKGSG